MRDAIGLVAIAVGAEAVEVTVDLSLTGGGRTTSSGWRLRSCDHLLVKNLITISIHSRHSPLQPMF